MRWIAALLLIALGAWTAVPATARAASPEMEQALANAQRQIDAEQPLEALKSLMFLLYEVWDDLPLTIKNATLVEAEPGGYGVYEPVQSAVFSNGKPIYIYLEPIGYGYADNEGLAEFGFAVDLFVLSEDGTVIGGQEDFGQFAFQSRVANLETFLYAEVTLSGMPPGAYALALDVRDMVSQDSARVSFDIEIAE